MNCRQRVINTGFNPVDLGADTAIIAGIVTLDYAQNPPDLEYIYRNKLLPPIPKPLSFINKILIYNTLF
jgi:hypothetical protein